MNQQDLENLPFPMFTTTQEEKELLGRMIGWYPSSHLCNRLKNHAGSINTTGHWEFTIELIDKIELVLDDASTLESYFAGVGICPSEVYDYHRTGAQVRDIWIKKLLAYKGE